jgi:hypothetical protein
MADNLSWLRRFAISLLKQHPSKHSIKGKSEIAGWNNDFLLQVLATLEPTALWIPNPGGAPRARAHGGANSTGCARGQADGLVSRYLAGTCCIDGSLGGR